MPKTDPTRNPEVERRSDRIDSDRSHVLRWRALKRPIRNAVAIRHRRGAPRLLVRCIRGIEDAKRATSHMAEDQARVPPTVS